MLKLCFLYRCDRQASFTASVDRLTQKKRTKMAILQLEDGTTYTQLSDIARELAPLNIQLNRWPVGDNPEIHNLLAKDVLDDSEKEQVLQALDAYFQQLKETAGYQSRDLIVLHPDIPNLDGILSKFDKCHIHADDEVRYIVAGEGIFGFVRPDGSQIEVTVQPEEFINVPANTEHWFYLTATQKIKAVRYFTSTEGWTPQYTDTEIRSGLAAV
jgi:1,2-dihydroxy-3-keto-5-methylthiopentene dioxygenase